MSFNSSPVRPVVNDHAYPVDLEADVLTDCGVVHVRPLTPDDASALVTFHEALSPESQYLRFFNAHPHLTSAEVERFTHLDYAKRLALVVELDGALVGVGRYDRLAGTTDAEVAFVVADAYQCHGLGGLLLHQLAAAAADRGIARFVAETLPDNQRMRAVFRESGFDVDSRFDDGVVEVVFPIGGRSDANAALPEDADQRAG
jgi:RimJ/RimL family protein N-acetyltransferase